MNKYQYTNQKQIRVAFKNLNPELRHRLTKGKINCVTSLAFRDFISSAYHDGLISKSLATRAIKKLNTQ